MAKLALCMLAEGLGWGGEGQPGEGKYLGEEGAGGGRMDLMRGMEKQVSNAQVMATSNFAVNTAECPWDQEMLQSKQGGSVPRDAMGS